MKSKKRIAIIIRLIARIWSALFLFFLVFMVGGHLIGALIDQEELGGDGFKSVSEMLQFVFCFPVATMIGLALAWKWEGLGGLITAGGIFCLFVLRPDLISNPFMVGMGICGLLFLTYWVLIKSTLLESDETAIEQRKTKRNNIIIALLISLVTLFAFIWFMGPIGGNSNITTKKDSSFNKIVEEVKVNVNIEEPLVPVFAHSFEHSLISAFALNGVESRVTINSPELDSIIDTIREEETPVPMPILHINIKPLYREHDNGTNVILGTNYEASLIDTATKKSVWYATGKIDYILNSYSKKPNYKAGDGIRKEFAWSTTAAIVNAFIAEINNQEPKKISIVTEERQRKGQRID